MSHRALVLWGGWDGHRPEVWKEYVRNLLEPEGFTVEESPDLDILLNLPAWPDLKLIVPVWTLGKLSKSQEKALLTGVAGGVGIGGWHGMCAAFLSNLGYQWMTGGQMVAHPGGCIPRYDVRLTDRSHPITRGLGDFTMVNTEQYYLHVDPSNRVLATTRFEPDCEMPVAWVRMWGRGRVFYSSLGHAPADFEVSEAHEILRRGLLWASGA